MEDIFTPLESDKEVPEDALEALVGEGKKYSDASALAKAKFHSDRHISILEKELEELRQANQKALTLEEVKTTILSQIKPPRAVEEPHKEPEDIQKPADQDSDLEAKVAALLERKEAEARAKTNREKVQDTLRERLGADAQIVLNEKAKELGVTLDYLAGVANNSPSAFFRLIGVDSSQPVSPTPVAPRSTEAIPPKSNSRTAYWENIKKTNPLEYFSKENTMKRHKEMMKGELPY